MEVERIPLRGRDGHIRAYTMVDHDDFLRFGTLRWCLNSKGRAHRALYNPRRTLYLHRAIMAPPPGMWVDHIYRNPLDNRRSNLRLVTRAQNRQNLDAYAGGSSRFRGVSWDREAGKWVAYASVGGRKHKIGRYADEEDAAMAAANFRRLHMPFSEEAA